MILDLEDAVAGDAKDFARTAVGEYLDTGVEVIVGINGSDTDWFADDVAALENRRCAVMMPKAHSAAQLDEVVAALPANTPLIALIETARGISDAAEICGVESVVRAAFGSIDLCAELGIDPDAHQALHYARSAVVIGSVAAGCAAPLDGVTTDLRPDGRIVEDLAQAASLGFTGKLCIHPTQVGAANEHFSPSAQELDWARRVVSEASGGSACVIDGKMVDKPVVDRARGILARVTARQRSTGTG